MASNTSVNALGDFFKTALITGLQATPATTFAALFGAVLQPGAMALPVQEAPALPAKRGRKPAAKKAAPKAAAKAAPKPKRTPKKASKGVTDIRDMEAFEADKAKITSALEKVENQALPISAIAKELGIGQSKAARRLKQMAERGFAFMGGSRRFATWGLSSEGAEKASLLLKGGPSETSDEEPLEDTGSRPVAGATEAKVANGSGNVYA